MARLTLGIGPALSGIPENALTNPSPVPGIRHGKGAMGKRGWAGPLPPRSHGPHTYAFQLFALILGGLGFAIHILWPRSTREGEASRSRN